MAGWILCSDKSPRQGQAVQVSDGHDVGVWRWRGFWPDNDWHRCSGSNHALETLRPVTHWKPLSEPPKEADNE